MWQALTSSSKAVTLDWRRGTRHEAGGLSFGDRRCWTNSASRVFLDVTSSRYFSDGSALSEVRCHHRPHVTRRTTGTRPDTAVFSRTTDSSAHTLRRRLWLYVRHFVRLLCDCDCWTLPLYQQPWLLFSHNKYLFLLGVSYFCLVSVPN